MNDEVFGILKNNISIFESTELEMNPDRAQTMPELLGLIDFYFRGKFKDGDGDGYGGKRYFYNINRHRVLTAVKATDVDTKDILLIAEEGQSEEPVWLMQKELKLHMKDNAWGLFLNALNFYKWKWGTVVVKKTKTGEHVVNLRNLMYDPTVENLCDSDFIIEKHDYTESELQRKKKEMRWDITGMEKDPQTGLITVYEMYGWVPGSVFETEEESLYGRFFLSKPRTKESDKGFTGTILSSEPFKQENIKKLYKDHHLERVEGRFLGLGFVEVLLEAQVRKNELLDQRNKGMALNALVLLQTSDKGTNRNNLFDLLNGEILEVDEKLDRVDLQPLDLSAFKIEEELWEINANALAFTNAPLTGEPLPSGTPLGSLQIQTQMALGYFDIKREEFGIFIKDILWDWRLPAFKKLKTKKHILKFVGDEEELEKFNQLFISARLKNRMFEHLKRTGRFPKRENLELWRIVEDKRGERDVEIPDSFYDDLKIKLDIVITGESMNIQAKMQSLQFLFQIIASNPAVLQDPMSRKTLSRMLGLSGINPMDVLPPLTNQSDVAMSNVTAEKGGSISVPAPGPVEAGQVEQTL